MPTQVFVLVYVGEPLDYSKYRHTALRFEFPAGAKSVMDIKGTQGMFEFEENTDYDYDKSLRLLEKIPVAEIPDSASAASIKAVIYATPIRNGRNDLDWNCQNWVGEVLARLVDNGYVSAAQRDQALDKMIDVCMEAGDEPRSL